MIENERKSRETICGEVINNPNSVFNVLTPVEKEELKSNMTCSFFKKGEYIYKEGERPIGLICLSEGKVKIFKEGVGGREQIVRMAKQLVLLDTELYLPKKTILHRQLLSKIRLPAQLATT